MSTLEVSNSSSSRCRTCQADTTSDVLMLPAGQVANVDGPVYGSCAETSKQKKTQLSGAMLQTPHQNYKLAEAQNVKSSNKVKHKRSKHFLNMFNLCKHMLFKRMSRSVAPCI